MCRHNQATEDTDSSGQNMSPSLLGEDPMDGGDSMGATVIESLFKELM